MQNIRLRTIIEFTTTSVCIPVFNKVIKTPGGHGQRRLGLVAWTVVPPESHDRPCTRFPTPQPTVTDGELCGLRLLLVVLVLDPHKGTHHVLPLPGMAHGVRGGGALCLPYSGPRQADPIACPLLLPRLTGTPCSVCLSTRLSVFFIFPFYYFVFDLFCSIRGGGVVARDLKEK